MNMVELDDLEYREALFDAFREVATHPDDYAPFWQRNEELVRSIAAFREAIDRIKTQLDAHYLMGEGDQEWVVRARSAKRHYEREHARLNRVRNQRALQRKKSIAESNKERFTVWSAQVHELLEEVCLRIEDLGGDVEGLFLPSNDGGEGMPLTDWLDIREERREKKLASDG